jgi:O-antigen ligase
MRAMDKRSNLKETFLFYYSLLLVILLLASVNIGNPLLLWCLIGGSVLLINHPTYLLPVYIISSLSTNYFIVEEGVGISRLIGFVLIIGGILYQIKNRYPFNKKHVIIIALLFIYCFVSSIFSLTGLLITFIILTQSMIVILLLSQIRNVNLEVLSKLLCIASVITILILALTLRENLVIIQAERLTTGDDVNQNRFAMIVAQLTAITFGSFLISNKRINKLLLLAVIVLAFFMLILSGSRSGLIGISGAILFFLFYLFKKHKKKIIIPFILLLCAVGLFINKIQQLNIPFINRFTIDNVVKSGGTHRLEVWKTLIPVTLENSPLFGYGLGGENSYALAGQYGLTHAAHNFVIDMFIQTGLVGLFLFFYYFFFLAGQLKRIMYNPYSYIPIMILLTALFNGIGETVYLEKLFWNGIALGFLYINNISENIQSQTPLKSS